MKRYILPIILCMVLLLGGGWLLADHNGALATSIDEINAAADASDDPVQAYRDALEQIRDRMDALEDQIAGQEAIIQGLKVDIAAIDAELTLVSEQLAVAENAIAEVETIIQGLDADIKDAEARLEERMAYLEERLVNLYVYGDISMLDVIFETSSFEEFITLFDMVEIIVEQDQLMAEEITKERQQIEADRTAMEDYLAELIVMQNEYYDMASDLKRLENEKIAAMNEANMTLAEFEAFYASEMATAEAASDKIRELLATSDSTLTYGGAMMWPLPSPWGRNWVTSEYGYREHPVYGGTRFHAGIDIGADGGTSIYAAADGKIILKEYYGGYGNTVMVDHGSGVVSLYAHMSSYATPAVGDYVVAGDVIGYVGTTGTSNGNHLHFEVRVNGEYTSPWNYLQ